MEKIKDFFYYIGDFLICILILSAMYFLITWKLDETMPIDVNNGEEVAAETNESVLKTDVDDGKKSVMSDDVDDETSDNQLSQNGRDERTNQMEDDNKPTEHNQEEQTDTPTEDKQVTSPSQDEVPVEENNNDNNNSVADGSYNGGTTSITEVSFTISAGMSGQDIANSLQEQGVIADSTTFINKLEELDLSSSLLAGDFELKQGMDYEEVIAILTGRN